MATPLILRGATLAIQSALASAKTITAISKASEASITATHDYSVGDFVLIDAVVGMTEINQVVGRVKSVSTTVSFVLEGIDSTNFTTYASGGTAQKITFGKSFDSVTNVDLPDGQPDENDITTIHDTERQVAFGHDAKLTGTLSVIANPLNAAVIEVQTAAAAQQRRAFLLTFASGQKVLWNAYCTGGSGFSGGVGSAGTGQIALTLRKKAQWFAS